MPLILGPPFKSLVTNVRIQRKGGSERKIEIRRSVIGRVMRMIFQISNVFFFFFTHILFRKEKTPTIFSEIILFRFIP